MRDLARPTTHVFPRCPPPKHGCIYTARRDSHVGLSSISSRVAELGKRPAPLWLVLFPEGTRLDPRKPELKRKSREFARRSSLALLDHVLTPRVKVTHANIQQWGGGTGA